MRFVGCVLGDMRFGLLGMFCGLPGMCCWGRVVEEVIVKILFVSGQLGAGKTTFIQAMARVTGLPFVVYENEYAGTGIDAQRLEEDAGLDVFESAGNCVCCSGKADFAESVLTISSGLDPEYLVVEPTGVARLGSLLANVRRILYGDMTVLRPVVIVDAAAFSYQRNDEIFLDQVRNAGVVVVSKTGRVLPSELAEMEDELHRLAPQADIVARSWDDFDAAWFKGLLAQTVDGESLPEVSLPGEDERAMDRLTASGAVFPSPAHLAVCLEALVRGTRGEVLRAKGCVPCGDEWVRFDVVNGVWEMTGDVPQVASLCVVIGRGLDEDSLSPLFPRAKCHLHRAHDREGERRLNCSRHCA